MASLESNDNAGKEAEEFRSSFALFDAEGRLVDWDEGFALELDFAAQYLKKGASYAELVQIALRDPGTLEAIKEKFGVADPASLLAERIRTFGRHRSIRYETVVGRSLEVDEQPTASGGIRRISRDVTFERQAEAALATAQHQLKAADTARDGVFVEIRRNPDGSYFFPPIPEGLCRLLDLPPDVAGADPMLVHTLMQVSPEDDARLGERLERSAQTLEICTLEYRVRDGKGRPRWIRQSVMPRREEDGTTIYSGFMRDVTRERDAEDQLQMLRAAVVRSGDSFVIFESQPPPAQDVKVLYVNPKFEELFGFVAADVIGKAASVLQGDRMSRYGSKLLTEALERGDGVPVEFEVRGRDGRLFWVEARAEIVQRLESGAFRWVSISRDVTERRRAQAELIHAKDAAEAGNRAKSNFLANMSHELRTPLNAIIGFTELIETGVGRYGWRDSYSEYLVDILRSSRHLLDLINTILDLSKIEAGSLSLDLDMVDLKGLIRHSRDLLAGMAEGNQVAIEADIADDCPVIEGDPLKLKQVILNILSNAIKFTPPGGRISIAVEVRSDVVLITVADTGCGIPAADLERVLLPFVQADNTLARKFPGSGLGLAIARQFCLLHTGHLEIASTEGVGTTVAVTLPLRQRTTGAGTRPQLRSIG